MKTYLKTIAVAAALAGAAAPAVAQSQLIANAGLTPVEAQGLTLSEIAAAKFSRSAGHDERHAIVARGGGVTAISRSADDAAGSQLAANAGLTPEQAQGLSLSQVAAAKFSRSAGHDAQQVVVHRDAVTAIGRSAAGAYPQLAASAGLTPDEALGLSLTEIAAAKFDRDTDN